MNKYYTLGSGTQVRREDFGLLFYQMNGPRLYFVATGPLLSEDFFLGKMTVEEWIDTMKAAPDKKMQATRTIARALKTLADKGVVIER